MIWVVTSDSATCRIYEYIKPKQLTLFEEINHPENKLRDIELTGSKPGHYKASNDNRGAYTQKTDPKEAKIDEFYREIAKLLNNGRISHAFEKLIIISSPHTSGLLFQHLDKHVKEMVINNIHKDLLHLSHQELLDFLQANAAYQDG